MRTRVLASAAAVGGMMAALLSPVGVDATGGPHRWIRVQFDHRITPGDRAALARTGVEGIQYVPDDAYVAFADARQATAADAVPGTTVQALDADDKIDPSVRERGGRAPVDVVAHPSAAGDVARVAGAAPLAATLDVAAAVTTLSALVDASTAERLAALPGVLHVGVGSPGIFPDDEASSQILADALTTDRLGRKQPAPGYEAFLSGVGLTGTGVVVSIADTGIDETHPEFAGRIVKRFDYGGGADTTDAGGHGTHVAGIVGGRGATLAAGQRPKDAAGFLLGLGIAPAVGLVKQPILRGPFSPTPPNDFAPFTRDALSAGAVAWNASWNTGPANSGYVARARSLDRATRDGDLDADGNQPFLMVFSAGNAGSGPRTITQPKEAKNIITVGSTLGSRVVSTDPGYVDALSSFSSRGPARDGRILPTVAAPGQDIVSSAASSSPAASCAAPTSAGGIEPFVVGQAKYSTCSGTSMAAPQVTGAVALLTEWWRKANAGANPSPAMAKALLVNTATDMGVADVPNNNEGWGRVNLARLFDRSATRVYADQSAVFTARDQEHTYQLEAVDPSRPVRATVVWTDAAAASGASKALVNDINLAVEAPDGSTFLGNVFEGGKSKPGGIPDRLNNVESVYLPAAAAGRYTVTLSAFNLPGDGIPGNGTFTDQDYALVVDNARLVG